MWNQHSLQILGIKFCVFKFHKDFYSQVFNLAIFFYKIKYHKVLTKTCPEW